jgi:hypothetical protein
MLKKGATLLLLAGLAGYLIFLFLSAMGRAYDWDELEAVHTGWKVAQGERIYVDFCQNHHESFYYLLVPFIRLAGESVVTLRVIKAFTFLLFLLQLGLTYLIAARAFSRGVGLLAIILLVTNILFFEAFSIRPDTLQTLLGLAAVFFLQAYYRRPGVKPLLASAVVLAIAFIVLQKAMYLIAVLGGIQLATVMRRKMTPFHFLLFWGVFALVLAPYLAYQVYHTSWSTYWACNWLLNLRYSDPDGARRAARLLTTSYAENAVMWVFYLAGLLGCFQKGEHRFIAVLSLGLFILAFTSKLLNPQYFMMALPFMAMVAASALSLLVEASPRAGVTVALSLFLLPAYVVGSDAHSRAQRSQLKRIGYVLANTTPQDYVYDGNGTFNLFRKDLDYFWLSAEPERYFIRAYRTFAPYDFDVLQLIDRYKPRIISSHGIRNMDDPRIREHYEPIPKFNDLFLRTR